MGILGVSFIKKKRRFAPQVRGQKRRYHPNYDHSPWLYHHIFKIDNEINRCSLLNLSVQSSKAGSRFLFENFHQPFSLYKKG